MADIKSDLPVQDVADGATGSAVPPSTLQVGGSDGTSLRTIKTDATGAVITSSKVSTTPAAPGSIAVAVTSTAVVAANTARKGLILVNLSTSTISLGFGTAAVLGKGITLTPYGVYYMDEFSFYTGAINAIAAVAGNLSVQELS